MRFLVTTKLFLFAVLCVSTVHAELSVTDPDDNDGVQLYRLTVTPAFEPEPVFKHRLMKPLDQLNSGNAAAFYRRIHAQNHVNKQKRLNEEFGDIWSDWTTAKVPLNSISIESLRKVARTFRYEVTHGARAGADCKRCDWGFAIEELRGLKTIEFILPEFQEMRMLARATAIHTRLAIVEGRYDDAIDLLRINYRMGRDTGRVPFLVCGLIGIAQVGITNSNALDLMAAPGSPNLYWALAELPDPIVPIRDAVRFEVGLGKRVFPLLIDAETTVRAPEEWNRLFSEAQAAIPQLMSGSVAWRYKLLSSYGGVAAGVLGYPHAKQRLMDWGYDAEAVEAMAVGQVLAIYTARVYQKHADSLERTFYLPYAEGRRLARKEYRWLGQQGAFSDDPDREIMPIADALLPAIRACADAQMRTSREMALLQAIEAVRMHAALEGELPASLDAVTCVLVPKNPATGEAFAYALEAGVAVFVLPESDGMRPPRRYEIRLAN